MFFLVLVRWVVSRLVMICGMWEVSVIEWLCFLGVILSGMVFMFRVSVLIRVRLDVLVFLLWYMI